MLAAGEGPWLDDIEPKWVPARRAIVALERRMTAGAVVERVCGYYGCEP